MKLKKQLASLAVMGMMSLGLSAGEEVVVSADGQDENDAILNIEKYLSEEKQ